MGSRIAIIGTGYVGLTTGACFAHLGHDVICADIDPGRIERLKQKILPIYEPGLQEIVEAELKSGRLQFVVGAAAAVTDCEFAYLCVQTPQGDDGSADLTYLQAAAAEIADALPSNAIVVNKSTVPVGSTKVVERVLGRHDVSVVSNPEFLREGQAVNDFLKPDRVVIGSDNPSAATRVADLYHAHTGHVLVTDPASAETIKYAANAFLATKISFANAVAAVCEAVGADVADVVLGIGYDKRIGHEFLKPGPGFGGSCFPKDTRAMVKIAEDAGYDFNFLKGVIVVNDEQRERMVAKVEQAVGGKLDGAVLAAWGLTFKANTDDLRESPAIAVLSELIACGAKVRAYDPKITTHPSIEVVNDPYDVCNDADALIVLTEWDEFRWLDMHEVRRRLTHANIVDTRNLLEKAAVIRAGFTYQGVGR